MIYRQGRNYENLNKMIYRGTGKFDTPCLVPEVCNADSFIGFNYAKSCKDPRSTRACISSLTTTNLRGCGQIRTHTSIC